MMTTIAKIIIEELIPSLLLSQIIKSAALQRKSCGVQVFCPNQFNFFCQIARLVLDSTLHAIFLCSWDLEIWHRVATPKCSI